MLRYYAVSTAIVIGAAVIVTAVQRAHAPLKVASVESSGTPSAARAQRAEDYRNEGVNGAAPWALSALPECFQQTAIAHGPYDFVRSKVPRTAQPVSGDVRLTTADCTLHVYANAALVERGSERLFVPADAHVFYGPRTLYLLRRDGAVAELRSYVLSGGGPIAFAPDFGATATSPPAKTCAVRRNGKPKC